MKKIIFATFLAAMVLSGCQKEDQALGQMAGEEVSVVMSASIPQELQTYGGSSAQGGINNYETDMYVRYIMEIYWQNQAGKKDVVRVARQIVYKKIDGTNSCKSVEFESIRMISAKYDFVFWADIVKKKTSKEQIGDLLSDEGSYYENPYFVSDSESNLVMREGYQTYKKGTLNEIRFVNNIDNREDRDAFTAHKTIDLRSEAATQNITLTRPFAKLRIIATDANALTDQAPSQNPMKATCRIQYSDKIPNTFNASTGKSSWVNDPKTSSGQVTVPTYTEEQQGNERTVYIAYLFPPSSAQAITLEITLNTDTHGTTGTMPDDSFESFSHQINNVPFYVNKLTTIKGNLFTKKTTMSVEVNDGFDGAGEVIETAKEVESFEGLKSTLNGETQIITLDYPITKDAGFTIDFSELESAVTRGGSSPLYKEGNTARLTLNFPSLEEGTVLTFIAQNAVNAPEVLYVNTSNTCSVRAKMPNTVVVLEGNAFNNVFLICNPILSYDIYSRFAHPDIWGAEGSVSDGYLFIPEDWADYTEYFKYQYEISADGKVVGNPGLDINPWDFVGGVNNPVP